MTDEKRSDEEVAIRRHIETWRHWQIGSPVYDENYPTSTEAHDALERIIDCALAGVVNDVHRRAGEADYLTDTIKAVLAEFDTVLGDAGGSGNCIDGQPVVKVSQVLNALYLLRLCVEQLDTSEEAS